MRRPIASRCGFPTAVIALFALNVLGATYYVPDNYATIQAALDAAADNDTIIVRDGTYTGAGNRRLDFPLDALSAVRTILPFPVVCP